MLGRVVSNAECRTFLSRVLSTNCNLFVCGTDTRLSRTSASMPFSMNHASALAWPVVQAGAGPVYLLKVHLGIVVFHEKASDLSSYLPVTPLPIVLNTNCNLFLAARMPNCLEPLVCVFFYDPCFREGVTGGPGRGRNLTRSTDQTLEPNTHRRRIPKGWTEL